MEKHQAVTRVTKDLRCPICHASMERNGGSLLCVPENVGGKRHCFDISKRGYVNLDLSHSGGGDDKALVAARTIFLSTGAYAPISDAINAMLLQYADDGGLIVDAGCGEGYYTARMAEELPLSKVCGLDLSKAAIDHAARVLSNHPAAFFVGGIFDLPLKDGCASAITSIFAPCAEGEFLRVLKPGGVLILAGAGKDHLMGLKRAVYETPYENAPRADLPSQMVLLEEKQVNFDFTLDRPEEIQALFTMTPYYYRTSREDMEKLRALTSLKTEAEVTLYVYQKPVEA